MSRSHKDEGLIIKKRKLLNGQFLITIFTKGSGKLVFSAFGIKKLTSKRLSHFEVGNYIEFIYFKKGDYNTLTETELKYGHMGIKESDEKLPLMYTMFFIINKIVPEDQPDIQMMDIVLSFMKELNKSRLSVQDLDVYITKILLEGGFIDEEKTKSQGYHAIPVVEELIGE